MSTDAPLLPDPAELPDDPAFLKRLVVQLFELLRQRDQRLSKLEHHLDVLLKKVFGRTSEKFDPRQLDHSPGILSSPTPGSVPVVTVNLVFRQGLIQGIMLQEFHMTVAIRERIQAIV